MINLFLASSPVEFTSACVVGEFLKSNPRYLLFNLALNREVEQVRYSIQKLKHYWDEIEFLEPGETIGLEKTSRNSIMRLASEVYKSTSYARSIRKKLIQLLGSNAVVNKGRGIKIFFNHFHPHVFYVMGILSKGERVYYPHGLDQPRTKQIANYSFQFLSRGIGTSIKTWKTQKVIRRSFYFISLWLRFRRLASIPYPFTGINSAVVFSKANLNVPYKRITEQFLTNELLKISNAYGIRNLLQPFFKDLVLDKTAIILLPELDSRFDNSNYLLAVNQLIRSICSKYSLEAIIIKPHVRSRYKEALRFAESLHQNKARIIIWPENALAIQTEIIILSFPVKCVGSLGSCAMPPWASAGIPHYVSREACVMFDRGWPNEKRTGRNFMSYELEIEDLKNEGIVKIID